MRFFVRTSSYQNSQMLNMCDEELLERVVKKDDVEIKISKSYYGQRLVGTSEARDLMTSASIINLVGEQSIKISIDLNLGSRAGVKTIQGVPFLIIFKM